LQFDTEEIEEALTLNQTEWMYLASGSKLTNNDQTDEISQIITDSTFDWTEVRTQYSQQQILNAQSFINNQKLTHCNLNIRGNNSCNTWNHGLS
jgi:hypothetical protein